MTTAQSVAHFVSYKVVLCTHMGLTIVGLLSPQSTHDFVGEGRVTESLSGG